MTHPVPLKHHTETAYIILLGAIICFFGFLTALLPTLDQGGLRPWSICFALAVLYPLLFRGTLRVNRADYEFRALHWFPALILLLWLGIELGLPWFAPLKYLSLGFFFLWSLPLVILGIGLLVIFSLHVIRRRVPRVVSLTLTLLLFSGVALASESAGLHDTLRHGLYENPEKIVSTLGASFTHLSRYMASFFASPDDANLVAGLSSSTASVSSSIDALQGQGTIKPVIDSTNLDHLSQTGPEPFALALLMLLALYSVMLHRRARGRMEV